jgi:hypothetical protein
MLQFRTHVLYIIDSIPEGELNTARQLRDDLEVIKSIEDSKGVNTFRIELKKLSTRDEVFGFFKSLGTSSGVNPILHFECHGDEKGIQFADDSYVTWLEIKPCFQKINEACGCNLFITLASCNGANLISSVQPGERSPFCGMIGVIDRLSVDNAQKSFAAFYSKLVESRDGSVALNSLMGVNLSAGSPRYYLFELVYGGYVKDFCNQTVLLQRARKLRKKLNPIVKRKFTLENIALRLKRESIEGFNEKKAHFFFEDLFPENTSRFSVTLEHVISASSVR